jgi:hypothetical protein
MKHAIAPVQHLPYWAEGPRTIGMPADPVLRYLAFAATDRSGLDGLFTDRAPGPGHGRIGLFEEAGIPRLGAWPSFAGYLVEAADAPCENRGVEGADGHRDTTVPGLVDGALVWDGPRVSAGPAPEALCTALRPGPLPGASAAGSVGHAVKSAGLLPRADGVGVLAVPEAGVADEEAVLVEQPQRPTMTCRPR